MADCSYARCIQQRRHIKRDLQRWTKNMVYIVGLERIAEELMGRRKWKLYQESMQQPSYLQPLNNDVEQKTTTKAATPPLTMPTTNCCRRKSDDSREQLGAAQPTPPPPLKTTIADVDVADWSPTSKCIFCVDGKLDEHNNHVGVLSPRHSESESSDGGSDTETLPTLTPPTPPTTTTAAAAAAAASLLNYRRHHNMTALETSMVAMAAVALGGGSGGGGGGGGGTVTGNGPPTNAAHLPYYGPLAPHWFIANVARNLQPAVGGGDERNTTTTTTTATGEQPLDLSSKGGGGGGGGSSSGGSTPNDSRTLNARLPTTIDHKHIYKAKPRMSAVGGRRTYTEEELQAALRDIQSGKLGTRRAAVIYGIPRSTLRNKIAAEQQEEEGMDDDKELSGAEEEKEVERALEAPLFTYDDLVNSDALKALLAKALGDDAAATAAAAPPPAAAPTPADSLFGSTLHTLLLRTLIRNQKSALAHDVQRVQQQMSNGDTRPDKEEDMETEEAGVNVILRIPSYKPTTTTTTTNKNGGTPHAVVSPSIASGSDSVSPPILTGRGLLQQKDVKDLIAKSLSQKLHAADFEMKRSAYTPPLGGATANVKSAYVAHAQHHHAHQHHHPHHHHHHQQHHAQQSAVMVGGKHTSTNTTAPITTTTTTTATTTTTTSNTSGGGGGGGGGGKGTRPKRGKYRNYDRDSLVEAVRAVQRGEMSVHRAGSYYGVPHSTLEYKVKERHLMRPRKRDPKPNPVDEKIATLRQTEAMRTTTTVAPPPPPTDKCTSSSSTGSGGSCGKSSSSSTSSSKYASSPNGIKMPVVVAGAAAPPPPPPPPSLPYAARPFPFWPHAAYAHIPLDYARPPPPTAPPPDAAPFFAAQMLEPRGAHLAATSATNAAAANLSATMREKAESLLDASETNGLLDGIIRSSLESGVPGDDRKEDRNVPPLESMSNKALLDQLCRNSRLTFKEEEHDGHVRLETETTTTTTTTNNTTTLDDSGMTTPRPGLIFLKQELTKPENLKPEMLMRFRDLLQQQQQQTTGDVTRNGVGDGSASESDAAQD